jgi:hypothetical protein
MMVLRPGKLFLVLLIPVALYGAAKGLMYFKAKSAMDDIVTAASNHAEIRYSGITTEVLGAVAVEGITVQPRGSSDQLQIDAVRLASEDPMFFIRGWDWEPGQADPPDHLSLQVDGLRMPLDNELFDQYASDRDLLGEPRDPCANGPSIEPVLLGRLGFSELVVSFGGHYRLDRSRQTVDAGWRMDVQDLQSMDMSIEMSDVDIEALRQAAPPQMNLAGFRVAVEVSPEFGRQALKHCAEGTELSVEQWSERYANQFVERLSAQGVSLGSGLQNAVRDFYRNWGVIEVVAAPDEPVGLLSLAFLPPNRLADAMSLRLSINDRLITDTRFTWTRPEGPGLSALFGAEPGQPTSKPAPAPRRIVVRREYESVSVGDLVRYVDHNVRIKPRGQPMREGLLKGIRKGQAEVEQTLHGGKFTVYVPVGEIQSAKALIQREVKQLP